MRVVFEIEVSDDTLYSAYGEAFARDRIAALAGESVPFREEMLRTMAWDFVVGKRLHGIDPDKREMTWEVVS